MDINSNCGINKDPITGVVSIIDTIKFGWEHIKNNELLDECKDELKGELFVAKDCINYVPFSEAFPGKSYMTENKTTMDISIPLIDIY